MSIDVVVAKILWDEVKAEFIDLRSKHDIAVGSTTQITVGVRNTSSKAGSFKVSLGGFLESKEFTVNPSEITRFTISFPMPVRLLHYRLVLLRKIGGTYRVIDRVGQGVRASGVEASEKSILLTPELASQYGLKPVITVV